MLALKLSEGTAARRRIPLYLVEDSDGKTPKTGVTFVAGDIKLSKNGAAEANHGGTVSELAGGMYYYEATAAELDTFGFVSIRFTKAALRTFVALVQVVAHDVYDAAGLGLSRIDAAITSRAAPGAAMDLVADAVDAAAVAASAVAEIQAGLATDAGLAVLLAAIVDVPAETLKLDAAGLEAAAAKVSLLTAVLKLASRVETLAGSLAIYRADAVTVHATQTRTTDPTMVPTSAVGKAT